MHRIASSFDFERQNWHTVYPPEASGRSGLVFYARVDGSFSVWDPLRPTGHLQFPLGVKSSGPVPGFHFSPSQIWNGLTADDHDGSVLCNGLIRDWTTWQLRRDTTFDLLTRVLEVLSPKPGETLRPGAITTRVSLHDVRDIPTLELFITTHAPLVLASAEPHFDETRDALFLFDLDGAEVTVSKPAWKPRGDASSWLTSDVFDLAQARSVEAERAILDAMAAMRRPDLPIEDAKRIHDELHEVLKDTDPFWARWLVRARQAGLTP